MREDKNKKGTGVSLDDDDAIETGLFSSGPATVKESIFAMYDYGGSSKEVPVWLLTFSRDGENDYEQPYSLGKGWSISKDGLSLIPKMGQTGLPKSCNAIRHLVKPLKAALKDADIDAALLGDGDPSVLEGMEVVLRRVEQEKRDMRGNDKKAKPDDKERSILEIEEVTSAPWEEGAGKKKKKKAADEDEDEAPAKSRHKKPVDDDEDEAPAKGKKKSSRDDDDDEDEKPAKGKSGKGKPADDDEDTVKELAIETLIDTLQDGAVEYDDLEAAVKKEIKGHKLAAQVVEWCVDTDNLELEKGWTYAKDKKTKVWTVDLA